MTHPPPLIASKLRTRLKSQQAPETRTLSQTQEEVLYTPQEFQDFAFLYLQNLGKV